MAIRNMRMPIECSGSLALARIMDQHVQTLFYLMPVTMCHEKVHTADFLCTALEKVASDTVKCAIYTLDDSFTDGRSYRPIHDTVASPRLDCVVAALTNLSRDGAQNAIRGGTVEVDFACEERTDRILTPPATISVRGYGRYILRAFDGETTKGRLRLRADQLV